MVTSHKIYDTLSTEIIYGTLAPDIKITEVLLAKRFGTSRGPVRDALQRLENNALITRMPNGSTRVVSFTPKQAKDLLHVLMLLECDSVKQACLYVTQQDIAHMESILDAHAQVIAKYNQPSYMYQHYNNAFHLAIAKASQNTYIEDIMKNDLYIRLQVCRNQNLSTITESRYASGFIEHKNIFNAIKNKDKDMAKLLMKRHLQISHNNIIETIPNDY